MQWPGCREPSVMSRGGAVEQFRAVAPGRRANVAKEDRGFASMDRAKQREIASKGGKAAHQKGSAHEWTSEEARDAGRKGGIASHQRRREQSQSSERASGAEDDVATDRGAGGISGTEGMGQGGAWSGERRHDDQKE